MDQIITESPIIVSEITLLPVVRCHQQRHNDGWFIAGKEPLAIIICDNNGAHAIDINASAIAMSDLLLKLPELESTLEQLNCKVITN